MGGVAVPVRAGVTSVLHMSRLDERAAGLRAFPDRAPTPMHYEASMTRANHVHSPLFTRAVRHP
jgi:hypothetical protein